MIPIPCPDCGGCGVVRNWSSAPVPDCDVIDCPTCRGRCEIDAHPDDVTDDTWELMMTIDNDNATPNLTAAFELLTTTVTPRERWALEGWLWHLRAARHQNHAASSWAKHREDFDSLTVAARAMAVARCLDFGMKHDEAAALLRERIAARVQKEHAGAAPTTA